MTRREAAMGAGRLLVCQPDGPLGTNAPQAIELLRRMLLGGEPRQVSYVVYLNASM